MRLVDLPLQAEHGLEHITVVPIYPEGFGHLSEHAAAEPLHQIPRDTTDLCLGNPWTARHVDLL
jgi:hypothetical protein